MDFFRKINITDKKIRTVKEMDKKTEELSDGGECFSCMAGGGKKSAMEILLKTPAQDEYDKIAQKYGHNFACSYTYDLLSHKFAVGIFIVLLIFGLVTILRIYFDESIQNNGKYIIFGVMGFLVLISVGGLTSVILNYKNLDMETYVEKRVKDLIKRGKVPLD